MEPIILILQIPILICATVAVTFGARLAFTYKQRLGHIAGVAGVAGFWAAAMLPLVMHVHKTDGEYVAWPVSHTYHVAGCRYAPLVETFDRPPPGMEPCQYCVHLASAATANAPTKNPHSNETSTVNAAVSHSFESIFAPLPLSASGVRGLEGE